MNDNSGSSGVRRLPPWPVLAAVAVLAAGGAWFALRRQPAPAPVVQAAGEETPAMRAARLGAIDSTQKRAWVDAIPDLDLSRMSPAQRELFLRVANTRDCTCGCGFTLAACRRFDSECDVSGPRAAALAESVAAGLVRDTGGLRRRPG
jgi:hypothetical protein